MPTFLKFLLFVFAIGFFVQVDPVSYVLTHSWTSPAQAIIGRPATPVSAARCGTAHDAALRRGCVSLLTRRGVYKTVAPRRSHSRVLA
jgi:hypothetical protein